MLHLFGFVCAVLSSSQAVLAFEQRHERQLESSRYPQAAQRDEFGVEGDSSAFRFSFSDPVRGHATGGGGMCTTGAGIAICNCAPTLPLPSKTLLLGSKPHPLPYNHCNFISGQQPGCSHVLALKLRLSHKPVQCPCVTSCAVAVLRHDRHTHPRIVPRNGSFCVRMFCVILGGYDTSPALFPRMHCVVNIFLRSHSSIPVAGASNDHEHFRMS